MARGESLEKSGVCKPKEKILKWKQKTSLEGKGLDRGDETCFHIL